MKARLGKKYHDTITGFEGTATSITEFLFGCRRVGLSTIDADGKPADFAFDEPGLVELKEPRQATPKQDTGGPHDRAVPGRAR